MSYEYIRYPVPLGADSIITFTTDFGLRDPYVAEMKGVILSGAPMVKLIDITHSIPPGDILACALTLERAVPCYPPGTIHLVVVDPGVGSERRPIVVISNSQIFVGPDNGFATLAINESDYKAYLIENVRAPSGRVSHTFHGRDIFAPACVHLARGGRLSDLGEEIEDIVKIDVRKPEVSVDEVKGEVIYVDHFGNLITNIREGDIKGLDRGRWLVRVGRKWIKGIRRYYSEVEEGDIIALIGSSGRLEIAVRGKNAEQVLGISPGNSVVVCRL
ncbi:MAG TPA: hypothetical protein ENI43_03510 [Firmicutes bacterium]|nr:hypothetical protein [Bacillota bacterium]